LEAQAIQLRLAPAMDAALAEGRTLGLDGIATSHPMADLWQGQQDRLYSRLFSS
jgi:urease accessory protein UreF